MKGTLLYCLNEVVRRLPDRASGERVTTGVNQVDSVPEHPDDRNVGWLEAKSAAGCEPFFTPMANYAPEQFQKLMGAAIYYAGRSRDELAQRAVKFYFEESRLFRPPSFSGRIAYATSLEGVIQGSWGLLAVSMLADEVDRRVRVSLHGPTLEQFADFAEEAARRLARGYTSDVSVIRLPSPAAVEEMKISFVVAEQEDLDLAASGGSRTP